MLGDKFSLIVNYNNEEKELKFNFQTLKNIYIVSNKNPFTFITEFFGKDDKYSDLGKLIHCMCNATIDVVDIYRHILVDKNVRDQLTINIINLLVAELTNEYKDYLKKDDVKKDDDDSDLEEDKDELQNWFDFWNNSYYVATIKLNKTEQEFLDMSPREFKTLDSYNFNYNKNILISAYIDVTKASSKADVIAHENKDKDNMSISEMLRVNGI